MDLVKYNGRSKIRTQASIKQLQITGRHIFISCMYELVFTKLQQVRQIPCGIASVGQY